MSNPIKILHLTTHLSGGVGAVLLSTLKYYENNAHYEHEIITLEPLLVSEKEYFDGYLKCVTHAADVDIINKMINTADIVQVEWWTHPLIYEYLIKLDFGKSRVIVCSHISGLHCPNVITSNLVKFSDIFIATTKASKNLDLFKNSGLLDKLNFINHPINFNRFKHINCENNGNKSTNETFNIGYVGTLNYSKLHKQFLSLTSQISNTNMKFIVCGEDVDNKLFLESKQYDNVNFEFRGFVDDLSTVFEGLDVFGYPLNDKHFGTGEQIIKEAMYAGLPVVCFDNPCERELIIDGSTGILVKSEQEYVEAIKKLYRSKDMRIKIGENARKHIISTLKPSMVYGKLNLIYEDIFKQKKTIKTFAFEKVEFNKDLNVDLGAKLFIEALGNQKNEFYESYIPKSNSQLSSDVRISKCEHELRVQNKGSIIQFLRYFPNDRYLNYWTALIYSNEKKYLLADKHFKLSGLSAKRINEIKKYI